MAAVEIAKQVTPTAEYFKTATVDDFEFHGEVVVIDSSLSTLDAFGILAKHNILSAPVQDKSTGKFLGFFDVQDMVAYVVETLRKSSEPDAEVPDMFADLRELLATIDRTQPNAVDSTSNMSKQNPFVPVAPGTLLVHVIAIFVEQGIRRVPVVDLDGKVVKLITQSALAKFLHDHGESLQSLKGQTVGNTRLGLRDVLQLGSGAPALRALELLYKHNVSAIALVDREDNDKLVAQFCSSDLKAVLSGKKQRFLGVTALQFVQRALGMGAEITRPPVTVVTVDSNLQEVVEKLKAAKVHRVFVVDAKSRPIGIISIRDFLAHLLAKVAHKKA